VVVALIRGFAARSSASIGNFWVDITRVTAWVLLPLSLVFAVFLVSQGVIQNFALPGREHAGGQCLPAAEEGPRRPGAEGRPGQARDGDMKAPTQTLAMGPVASQEAIKMLGTNGGGFFNANSAHPYENPSALSNFLQMLAIFLIPRPCASCLRPPGGRLRQGWAVLAAMTAMFVVAVVAITPAEQAGQPIAGRARRRPGRQHDAAGRQHGRQGSALRHRGTGLFAAITTAASCGAVNGMHDSFTPLGGMVPLVLMQLGEVVFGGVGSGLYGMLIFAILAVFIAGLMIGRTPEYLGKKIEIHEMKLTSIAILVTPTLVLPGTPIAVWRRRHGRHCQPGRARLLEILYAFTSAGNNNGSAFAGLSANTPFYNTLLGIAMWLGRFGVIVPVLAIAGSLAAKKRMPVTAGTMPTHGPLFVGLLIGTVLLVGLLNYVPALALGPVVEHIMLWSAH
jgi:K+-transporting ATPase ATPase A chain